MFAQTWRDHWSLSEDPFAYEDADKDPIMSRVDAAAVHSSFDRIFGNPETPAPGIVFGEKGSGKSGLRLAIQRRIEKYNENHPEARVFLLDYTEFDDLLDRARQSGRHPDSRKGATETVRDFRLVDHIDAILSRGVTTLINEWIATGVRPKKLDRKTKADLLALTSLYYESPERSRGEGLERARKAVRFGNLREGTVRLMLAIGTLAAAAIALVPHYGSLFDRASKWDLGPASFWYSAGAFVFLASWIWFFIAGIKVKSKAKHATRSVHVLRPDPAPLMGLMKTMKPATRQDLALPDDGDEASRFHLLGRFLSVLRATGYRCVYLLMDRVDESTFLRGTEEYIRPFVEKLLDHKLLQHSDLAMKLFLPVELGKMYLGASPEELRRMRLDKSNTVGELRWTGQELYEVANERLRAAKSGQGSAPSLGEFFSEDVAPEILRDTLHELGTPRTAFGFLSALFAEYARNLPEELDADAEEWHVPRSHFELVRASWGDRARVMRRALN